MNECKNEKVKEKSNIYLQKEKKNTQYLTWYFLITLHILQKNKFVRNKNLVRPQSIQPLKYLAQFGCYIAENIIPLASVCDHLKYKHNY